MDFGPPADRLLALQGCTDAAWREPCPQYFAEHRYDAPGADVRVLIWVCSYDIEGEYCVGSPDYKGVSTWDTLCGAGASKRIKTIPWFNSMHMALDPTMKIEIWHNSSLEPESSGGGNSYGDSTCLGV